MASDLVTCSAEQHCIIKLPVKEKLKLAEILCRLNAWYEEVSVIGTVSILKAIEQSGTHHMLMFNQHLYAV
jgi:hypothetical protein